MRGTITVNYDGQLERELLEYLTAHGARIHRQWPLVVTAADIDELLHRLAGFLSPEALQVKGIVLRRFPAGTAA